MRLTHWIPALALAALLATPSFAAWPENGLPVGTGAGVQRFETLVPDDAGGAYVFWWSNSATPSHVQRVTREGAIAPGWPAEGLALGTQVLVAATADDNGGIYLLSSGREWVDTGPAQLYGRRLFVHHFDRWGQRSASWPDSGIVVWSEQYPMGDDNGLKLISPRGSFADGAGGATFALKWERAWLYEGCIVLHVDSTGTCRNDAFALSGYMREIEDFAPDALGGLTILKATAYYSAYEPDTVAVRRYSPASGFTPWRTLGTGSYYGAEVQAIRLAPGPDVLLSWKLNGERLCTLLRVDALLDPAPLWPAVGVPGQLEPLCSDAQGGVLARAWVADSSRVQRLDVSAAPATALWPSGALPIEDYRYLVADGLGGFFQATTRPGYPLPPVDTLRAFHVGANGQPAPSWPSRGRVIAANAQLDSWGGYYQEGHGLMLAEPGAALIGWTQLPSASSDAFVQRLADDVAVPTAVGPPAARLALRGFVRNPTTLDATVEFTLTDARPARLELFDVSGRLLARRDVGAMGAGSHRVRLGDGLSLRPGLLFARLVRGGEARTAKAALLR